jgi:sRNA-binding protein
MDNGLAALVSGRGAHLRQLHTGVLTHESYRKVMIEGAGRVDLDGNPAGFVTKSQAELSAMKLKRKVKNTTKATLAAISAT